MLSLSTKVISVLLLCLLLAPDRVVALWNGLFIVALTVGGIFIIGVMKLVRAYLRGRFK